MPDESPSPFTGPDIPANPSAGPDIALRQSDAEQMSRSMKGVTSGRAAGMAHQTAERQMKNDYAHVRAARK